MLYLVPGGPRGRRRRHPRRLAARSISLISTGTRDVLVLGGALLDDDDIKPTPPAAS